MDEAAADHARLPHVPERAPGHPHERHELAVQRASCGTSYTLSVEAADAAGNTSATATISQSTDAVPRIDAAVDADSPRHERGHPDLDPTLGWTASTDNVGVTGYPRLP